jgi:Ca2+-binding RTX toxin-like protein
VPKCKRRVPVHLVATLATAGAFTATAVAATVDGDDGPNRLKGSPEADVIQAFGGDDRVRAFAGDDRVLLGDGDDRAFAGPGDDDTEGGPGDDRIRGRAGNDTNDGGEGDDRLAGGPGDDEQAGGPGDDRIFANHGRDVTDGGEGDDRLWALIRSDVTGPGDIAGDVVRGAGGNDRIRTRDGELDVIGCGPGFDVAVVDFADAVDGDCERVRRHAPRPGGHRREGDG